MTACDLASALSSAQKTESNLLFALLFDPFGPDPLSPYSRVETKLNTFISPRFWATFLSALQNIPLCFSLFTGVFCMVFISLTDWRPQNWLWLPSCIGCSQVYLAGWRGSINHNIYMSVHRKVIIIRTSTTTRGKEAKCHTFPFS